MKILASELKAMMIVTDGIYAHEIGSVRMTPNGMYVYVTFTDGQQSVYIYTETLTVNEPLLECTCMYNPEQECPRHGV